ncbi:MAG TPA: ROK family protein [Acidimicrobiia bacterium]|nr:ROK family protein [Acidimicrobiia bacterium]
MTVTIGLDIGGTKVLGAVVDADGRVAREHEVPSPDDLEPLVRACAELVDHLEAPGAPVGVGAAGLVDHDGFVRYAPNIPGVRNAALRAELERATGRRVLVDNDANVAALGEVVHGAAQGAQHALMITLGTGIGGGIIIDGRVYRGAHGFAAEIGHFQVERDGPLCACGEYGHWEAIASGTALGRMAREMVAAGAGAAVLAEAGGAADAVSGEHVGAAASAGDPDALALVARYADNVAIGLAALVNILDPEIVVVSGGLVAMGRLLFDPLEAAFRARIEGTEYRPEVPIVIARLGTRAGVIGAAALARELLPGS